MKKYLYGIDVGGTAIKMGLFTVDGELIDQFDIRTRTENGGEMILTDIAESLTNHYETHGLKPGDIQGVGIGVPGPVHNGVVNRCVNLGWGIVNVKSELENLIHLPVFVGNDANVAGLGELWKGSGKGYSSMVLFTLGTGIGGAVIVDGKVIEGISGAGGEIGHAPIPDAENGYQCNCGKRGCLETVASATGVVRVAKDYLSTSDEPSSLRQFHDLSAKKVFDAAKNGDALALRVVDQFGKNIGYICSILASALNPEAFVFGGGMAKAGPIITETIEKHFKQYAFFAVQGVTQFKLASLGNDAGIYGAAYLAKTNTSHT